ncbi:MAG: hypothetical protein ACR2PH_07165 [Desulfobulbia bacterium]
MDRLWVVEARFKCGTWGICNFGLGEFASTNFYKAHEIKRKEQEYLQTHGSKEWYKNCFRVREYTARRMI